MAFIRMHLIVQLENNLVDDFDFEAIALTNFVDDFLVILVYDPTKDGMNTVEVGGCGMSDEELAATCIGASMGHGQGAWKMFLGVAGTGFAIDLIARATSTRHARGASLLFGQPPWIMKLAMTR